MGVGCPGSCAKALGVGALGGRSAQEMCIYRVSGPQRPTTDNPIHRSLNGGDPVTDDQPSLHAAYRSLALHAEQDVNARAAFRGDLHTSVDLLGQAFHQFQPQF